MKRNLHILFFVFSLMMGCREKYVPQLNESATGYLVVEGFINSGLGPTTISLSKTFGLAAKDTLIRETRAIVKIESRIGGAAVTLPEISPGQYSSAQVMLNANDQYRVHIKTINGKEYISDYSDVRFTPAIDSISWRRESGDVKIYGSSHNTQDSVGFYEFVVDETWEFYSAYQSFIKIFLDAKGKADHIGYKDSIHFGYDTAIYKCWNTHTPSTIITVSTEKLGQNVASMAPLLTIPKGDIKLSSLYSTNVKMYYISKKNQQFLDILKKNTESLGSIFDAQPAENNGNVHSISNPDERVIGFVEVTSEKQKRIFISNADVPGWGYDSGCNPEFPIINQADSLQVMLVKVQNSFLVLPTRAGPTVIPFFGNGPPQLANGYFASAGCVDCTLRGINKKPAFWP